MNILEQIIAIRRTRVDQAKSALPIEQISGLAREDLAGREPHRLRSALIRSDRTNIIAEIKRASPSRGVIRGDVNPGSLATIYETNGAAAISILTEEDHFQGSLDDLRDARRAVSVPLLRKDFVFDEYQVYESAAAGADAILLIAAALDDRNLGRLRELAEEGLGIDALVEVHTEEEMNRAARCGAQIIGINNRDLRSFQVSLETSVRLARIAPDDAILVSESGINSADDIKGLRALGYQGFLVGETLMRADDPGQLLARLLEI